jgi:hypothetical protein
MGNKAEGSQGSQVFYDPEIGQYYTQAPQNRNPMEGFFNVLSGNIKGNRNYLNNLNQSSPSMQQQAPYQYADTSLASLFPMLQGGGAMQGSQGGEMGGLLGATGGESSGAGRFM